MGASMLVHHRLFGWVRMVNLKPKTPSTDQKMSDAAVRMGVKINSTDTPEGKDR